MKITEYIVKYILMSRVRNSLKMISRNYKNYSEKNSYLFLKS